MILLFLLFGLTLGTESPSEEQVVKLERGNCPMHWHTFNGRCYKYVATHMTWADAELHCLSVGANLVSVHSLEEHNFVNSLIKTFDPASGFAWNGFSDIHKEGAWMWSDGSPVNFSSWETNQPDNAKGLEHCGHTNVGDDLKWNDLPCSKTIHFVCASRTDCLLQLE